jgi:hypothetical protein
MHYKASKHQNMHKIDACNHTGTSCSTQVSMALATAPSQVIVGITDGHDLLGRYAQVFSQVLQPVLYDILMSSECSECSKQAERDRNHR